MTSNSNLEEQGNQILKDIGTLDGVTEELNELDVIDSEAEMEEVGSVLTVLGKALLAIFK